MTTFENINKFDLYNNPKNYLKKWGYIYTE